MKKNQKIKPKIFSARLTENYGFYAPVKEWSAKALFSRFTPTLLQFLAGQRTRLTAWAIAGNQKVMLDRDLAELCGVETKHLKRQVNRNQERFPEDFMFELNKEEFEIWRSQFGTSKFSDKMGLRYAPYAFTEHGVLMLSSVLSSSKAVKVNLQIMRLFTKLRRDMIDNTELRLLLEKLTHKTDNNTKNIEVVFQYLDELMKKKIKTKATTQIGFNQNK